MYSTRKTWHRGTAVELAPGMTVEEQLSKTDLNWQVELGPVYYGTGEHKRAVPGQQAAYRSDNEMFISFYTRRKPWQNKEIVETFNRFCDQAELPMTHLGSLDKGRVLYAAAQLPEMQGPMKEKGDVTEGYLILQDSHINGKGLTVSIYANRLVCTNGMVRHVKLRQKTIAHVGKFDSGYIRELLAAARTTFTTEQERVNQLSSVTIDKAEAALQLIAAFGDPSEPVEKQPQIVRTCMRLFDGRAKGSEMLSTYSTAYGLLNAVTEFYNHHQARRGGLAGEFQSVLAGARAKNMAKFEKQLVSCYNV